MHGANSRHGANHPNYRHGRTVKDPPLIRDLLKPSPIVVSISLFRMTVNEVGERMSRGERLEALRTPLAEVTIGEWMRALRTARRALADDLRELRDYVNGKEGEP
jgi:hypothetical protein